jgi:hypothetical protein
MLLYIFILICILLYLFFVLNSIIWLKSKNLTNLNDIIIKYLHYADFFIFAIILLFIIYLYINNLKIKLVYE